MSLIIVEQYQIDPIALSKDPSLLPAVTYPDIYNYIVHTVSAFIIQALGRSHYNYNDHYIIVHITKQYVYANSLTTLAQITCL